MHCVLHALHHPTGISLVPILFGAFVVGFAVQRVLAAAGNRWWPAAEHRGAANEDPSDPAHPVDG